MKRIFKYCLEKKFPKIPFIPLTQRISWREFIDRYVQVNLLDSNEYIDENITRSIIEKGVNDICLYGEGGMGKTFTAYKVSFNLVKKGYLPVLLDASSLPSKLDEGGINKLIGDFFGDTYILSIMDSIGFSKYCFIIDNYVGNKITPVLTSIHGFYPNSIILLTTRSNGMIGDFELSCKLTSSTVDFKKYIKSRVENRVNSYRSFILEIKNILLISIISNDEIDITDIVRQESSEKTIKDEILFRYIDYQVNSICSKYLPDIKDSHSSYLINKMLCVLAESKSGKTQIREFILKIEEASVADGYLNEVINLVVENTLYKTKIQIMDLIENSAIVYTDSSHNLIFTHDLISESLIKSRYFEGYKGMEFGVR